VDIAPWRIFRDFFETSLRTSYYALNYCPGDEEKLIGVQYEFPS
jgi:hypothetical protein